MCLFASYCMLYGFDRRITFWYLWYIWMETMMLNQKMFLVWNFFYRFNGLCDVNMGMESSAWLLILWVQKKKKKQHWRVDMTTVQCEQCCMIIIIDLTFYYSSLWLGDFRNDESKFDSAISHSEEFSLAWLLFRLVGSSGIMIL